MSNRELEFVLRLRDEATKNWERFKGQVQTGANQIQQTFGGLGRIVVGAFSIAALKGFVSASNEAALADVKLSAVLASTEHAAGMTQAQLDRLADSLEKVTAYEHDTIKEAEAMLLSFRSIGGDLIPQATEAAANLAKKFGMDVPQAAKLLGKALEDPLMGMTALKRMGLVLNEQQKADIKHFLAAGDAASAQKVILKALEVSVGGLARAFAETAAGKIQQFENSVHHLEESFGAIIKTVVVAVLPAVEMFVSAIRSAPVPIQAMVLAMGALTAAMVIFGAALLTNPITWLIMGIAAACVGLAAAMNKSTEATATDTEEVEKATIAQSKYLQIINDSTKAEKEHEIAIYKTALAQQRIAQLQIFKQFGLASDAAKKANADFLEMERRIKELTAVASGKIAVTTTLEDLNEKLKKQTTIWQECTTGTKEYYDAWAKVRSTQTEIAEATALNKRQYAIDALKKEMERMEPASEAWIAKDKQLILLEGTLEQLLRKGKMLAAGEVEVSLFEKMWTGGRIQDTINDVKSQSDTLWSELTKSKGTGALGAPIRDYSEDTGAMYNAYKEVIDSISQMERTTRKNDSDWELEVVDDWLKKVKAMSLTMYLDTTEAEKIAEERKTQIRAQSFEKTFNEYAQLAQKGVGLMMSATSQQYDAELDSIQTAKDAELGRVDAALKNDRLTADQRAKLEEEKAAITQKYDDQTRATKKKQWEADREGRMLMAVIDTAAAVVKALPDIPLAIIAGAMGVAQVAIIASQASPKFKTGTSAAGFTVPQGFNNDNFPVLVSSGERVRVTPRGGGGDGATLNFYFNAPVSDEEFVYQSIVKRLRATGMPIDRTFRSPNVMVLGNR